ncbi:MAG: hypothetical protein PHR68_03365 [Candidatus Gracilibacteria bacterium]|nr:hypothetical protein [Candidatus Gracilibacteria bacterium]
MEKILDINSLEFSEKNPGINKLSPQIKYVLKNTRDLVDENLDNNILKCPNCDEETFHLVTGCNSCGYGKNIELDNFFDDEISANLQEENIIKKSYFEMGLFSSYEYRLNKNNDKIDEISFKFKDKHDKIYKFKISIEYDIENKVIEETNFYESKIEDREIENNILKINNLKILAIQEKVKVGYGEKKDHIAYYSYLGLNNNDSINFVKSFLADFYEKIKK